MTIRILPCSKGDYHNVLTVMRGRGDAKLIAWLGSRAKRFELINSDGAWLIRVQFTGQASYIDFIETFKREAQHAYTG